jgi:hypothetical protein
MGYTVQLAGKAIRTELKRKGLRHTAAPSRREQSIALNGRDLLLLWAPEASNPGE